LSQLKWYFDANKLSSLDKQAFLNALQNSPLINTISKEKVALYTSLDDITDLNKTAKLIAHLSADNVFTSIFKLK